MCTLGACQKLHGSAVIYSRTVAKGNAQRARSQRRTAAPPPPPPRPSTLRTRQFWLGVLAAAALLIPLGVIGVVLAGNGDAPSVPAQPATASPTTDPAVEAETERLKKVSQTRDK